MLLSNPCFLPVGLLLVLLGRDKEEGSDFISVLDKFILFHSVNRLCIKDVSRTPSFARYMPVPYMI